MDAGYGQLAALYLVAHIHVLLTVQHALPRSAILTGKSVQISLTGSGSCLLSTFASVQT